MFTSTLTLELIPPRFFYVTVFTNWSFLTIYFLMLSSTSRPHNVPKIVILHGLEGSPLTRQQRLGSEQLWSTQIWAWVWLCPSPFPYVSPGRCCHGWVLNSNLKLLIKWLISARVACFRGSHESPNEPNARFSLVANFDFGKPLRKRKKIGWVYYADTWFWPLL